MYIINNCSINNNISVDMFFVRIYNRAANAKSESMFRKQVHALRFVLLE